MSDGLYKGYDLRDFIRSVDEEIVDVDEFIIDCEPITLTIDYDDDPKSGGITLEKNEWGTIHAAWVYDEYGMKVCDINIGAMSDLNVGDQVIVDLSNMGLGQLESGIITPIDLSWECSMHEYPRMTISGYFTSTKDGRKTIMENRCHLCNAGLVSRDKTDKTEIDWSPVDIDNGEPVEKRIVVQTDAYECGTVVERRSDRRANVVKVGPRCIQLASKED